MAAINVLFIQGHLVRAPELRYVGDGGTALCQFAVAHSRNYQRNGQWEKEVSYINVKCWAAVAERAAELHKGCEIVVNGRLTQEKWTAGDGSPRSKLVLVADRLDVVGQPRTKPPAPQQSQYVDDDLPF